MQQKTLSAGVVVTHIGPDSCRYLLLRCFRNWDFPKGIVEAGETAFSAAKREVREETTLDELDFRWGEISFATVPYGRRKVARIVRGIALASVIAPLAQSVFH